MSAISDVSNGLEKYPVVLDLNPEEQPFHVFLKEISDLEYVKTNVPGPGCERKLLSEQYIGCACEEECAIETCSCYQYFGCAYDNNGRLQKNFTTQQMSKPILECGDNCSCSRSRCTNRVVQKGANGRFCIFHCQEKGFGLKTLEALEQFCFVCEYAGEIVGRKEARKRLQHSDRSGESNYLISLKEHILKGELCTFIDPRRIGNLGRFINHSCDPNLVMLPVRVNHSIPRLALFCRRDLKADEEMTFDYSGRSTFSSCISQPFDVVNKTLESCQSPATVSHGVQRDCTSKINFLSDGRENVPASTKQIVIKRQGLTMCKNHKLKTRSYVLKWKRNLRCRVKRTCSSKKTLVDASLGRKQCMCKSEHCLQFLPFNT